jgi:hypothetical protein
MKSANVDVVVGEGTVTVKREGSNRAVLAKILGTVEVDGIEVICLDRLVHGFDRQLTTASVSFLSEPGFVPGFFSGIARATIPAAAPAGARCFWG